MTLGGGSMTSDQIRKNINSLINQKITIEHMYTQAEFGELCGVSKTTVGKWCNDTCPTADKIPAICEHLHISIFELLGIKDPSIISKSEQKLLDQYNAHPEMQEAINKLLGI